MHLVPGAEEETALPPPVDSIEENERIAAFWQVYVLDKTWSIAAHSRSGLLVEDGSPRMTVDTPWPLAIESFAEGNVPPWYGSVGGTIQRFLTDTESAGVDSGLSVLASRAQAAALLDRASWLSSTYSSDPSILQTNQFAFEAFDTRIEKFILSLPSLTSLKDAPPYMQPTPEVVRSLVVTHCVARLAAAQLHSPWVNETIKSSAKCLSACKAIIAAVGVMPQESLRCVDPFLIVLLTFAAHMIIGELVHRAKGTSLYQGPYPLTSCVNPVYLTRALDEAVTLIGAMNRGSKFTEMQLEAIQKLRAAVPVSGLELIR
ncbi:hypothetical protein EW026_g6169 [Hermanssonia centrifuga]|uniref:Transcription factor domain-containing protein n=1 Tax=Hermanssonia centrifuga TaxID=98765 RepID=A0A4S4KCS9_9APHY|nr:hypothetical protein EW026_g6169 [Hermanssonia centrifuga]